MAESGYDEEVAVKCVSLASATPEQEAFARRELQLMCTVSQKLSGYVMELKGFHLEEGVELLLAMELADGSLHDYLKSKPGACLQQDEWVRARLRVSGVCVLLQERCAVWQTLRIGNSPRVPNILIIFEGVHGEITGHGSAVVCQSLVVVGQEFSGVRVLRRARLRMLGVCVLYERCSAACACPEGKHSGSWQVYGSHVQVAVAMQLCEALTKLHALNVIHRDVSPTNSMRTLAGGIKLADFGIAVMCDTTRGLTQRSQVVGNVSYMAPEQGDAHAHLTDRADIWAFGATMLQAWTGDLPYGRLSQHQIMRQHVQGRPPPLDGLARPLPPPLRDVLDACFQVQPADRPAANALHHKLKDTRRRTQVRL